MRLWEAAFEASRLPPTLRSKGFFWVAARPQRIWQWSTAGKSCVKYFAANCPCVLNDDSTVHSLCCNLHRTEQMVVKRTEALAVGCKTTLPLIAPA